MTSIETSAIGVDSPVLTPSVIIDGVIYEPAEARSSTPQFAIGITTHNRWDLLAKALSNFARFTPADVPIIIVDDGSTEPAPAVWDGRFTLVRQDHLGVAAAKNRCLEEMSSTGVDHFFLFDDDAWPQSDGWWQPYVESPEPHLMYCFQDFAGVTKPTLKDCRIVHRDQQLIGYSVPRGVMLYAHRSVLDRVGGMDRGFGMWGYEHGDWSNRIHSAGLTTMRYGDVPNSDCLIYSVDEHVYEVGGHERSLSSKNRSEAVTANKALHDQQWNSGAYREYRASRDVVLSAYIAGVQDPQRRRPWAVDANALLPLRKSVGDELVVLSNDRSLASPGAFVETPASSPYFARWLEFYRYLRAHREIQWVWCVDATDVVMLHRPSGMADGVLYVGSEPSITDIPWMRDKHPEYADWIRAHGALPLLNCGIVGGDRATVMRLCHSMIREYHDLLGRGVTPVLDMGMFNFVVREHGFKVITGPQVHTVFRSSDHANAHAWWAHK